MMQATKISPNVELINSLVDLVWSYKDLTTEFGLPGEPGDRSVLRLMSVIGASENPPRLSELVERVGLDLSTLSRHATTLTRDGLIERIEDPADKRAFRIRLSPTGEQLLSDVLNSRCSAISTALRTWSDEEKADASAVLQKLTRGINSRREKS